MGAVAAQRQFNEAVSAATRGSVSPRIVSSLTGSGQPARSTAGNDHRRGFAWSASVRLAAPVNARISTSAVGGCVPP